MRSGYLQDKHGWNAIVETIVKPAGFPDMQPKTPLGPETNEILISNYQKLTVKHYGTLANFRGIM